MRRVLFIDDRPNRQIQSLPNGLDDFITIQGIKGVDVLDSERIVLLLKAINSGIIDGLINFDLLIFHRSSLSQKGIDTVRKLCKNSNISFILFSGSLSPNTYFKQPFPLLVLNSKDLYSDKLIPFLISFSNDKVKSITELLYGENWELPLLMRYRQLINKIEDENDLPISMEEALDSLIDIFGKLDLPKLNKLINEKIEKV